MRPCRARIRPAAELDWRQIVRTIGIARARFKIGMMNLGYNIRRLVQLKQMAPAPGQARSRVASVCRAKGQLGVKAVPDRTTGRGVGRMDGFWRVRPSGPRTSFAFATWTGTTRMLERPASRHDRQRAARFHIAHCPLRHHARAQWRPDGRPADQGGIEAPARASLCAGASPTIDRSPSQPRELRLAWRLQSSLPVVWALCELSKSIGSGQRRF